MVDMHQQRKPFSFLVVNRSPFFRPTGVQTEENGAGSQNAIDQIIGHAELKVARESMRQQLPLCRNGRFLPAKMPFRHMGKLIKNDRHRIR